MSRRKLIFEYGVIKRFEEIIGIGMLFSGINFHASKFIFRDRHLA